MELWWVRHPGVLDAEKAALDAWGRPWELDQAEFDAGRLVVRVQAPFGAASHQLTALYPASYPYFPPQVRLDGLRLPRHHNTEGFLCLLANDAEAWRPGQDTLAGILQSQLPQLLAAADPQTDANVVAHNEEHAGEPLSNFLEYLPNAVILVPDEAPPDEIAGGRLELRGRVLDLGVSAVLSRVLTFAGGELVNFPVRLPEADQRITGNWTRLTSRPVLTGTTPEAWRREFYDLALASSDEFKKKMDAAKAGEIFIFGFVYPDEVSWRQSKQDWVFLWVRVERPRKGVRPPFVNYALVHADPAGDLALAMRAPELVALRTKCVYIVGLGAIGSPVAIQLAKSGIGKLELTDGDRVQVGNTIRWALGWPLAGRSKAEAVASYVASQYPRTAVQLAHFRIGVRLPDSNDAAVSDYDILRERIARSDLVIDASASYLVNCLVTDIARREQKPYLWLSTTPGAAGGVVGRVVPGKTAGCFHCYMRHIADGSLAVPKESAVEDVQPGGCGHPTFVAAGVDSDEVAVLAARLAVATLVRGTELGMDFGWDVAIGDLKTDQNRIAGRWAEHALARHPECPLCA
jgi:molybdopterin/thiamine biosynthesis adenylyltransferase/ubiquitin-protein ligase